MYWLIFVCQLDTQKQESLERKEPQLRKGLHEIQLEGIFSISDQLEHSPLCVVPSLYCAPGFPKKAG